MQKVMFQRLRVRAPAAPMLTHSLNLIRTHQVKRYPCIDTYLSMKYKVSVSKILTE